MWLLVRKKCTKLKSRLYHKISKHYITTNVIIGGVAGGASCAARLRRLDENCKIIMYERGPYVSFANCGLPYYVGNIIKKESKLLVANPELFKNRFDIDVLTNSNVLKIDRKLKKIFIKNLINNELIEQNYDNLILAVGASPIKPKINGLELDGVFSVRTIENSQKIREYIDGIKSNEKKAVIVGGGFIGLEMTENLVWRNMKCTIIDGLPQVMGPVDKEMSLPFNRVLVDNGVDLLLNEKLKEIKLDKDGGKLVVTESGKITKADLVILGLGVLPENKLANDCGLELGVRGSIKVDKHMRTSDENIYCVGDVVETYNFITNDKQNITLAGPAQQQARIVANIITGQCKDTTFRGVQGSSVCELFGEIVASTGLSEKHIKDNDKDNVVSIYIHAGHHADFYPNAKKIHLKVLFNKQSGKILGAQACGEAGITKAIDTIATFIQMNGTVQDLAHAELCYSPSQGSARGPVNIIGQVGMNIKSGLIDVFNWNNMYNDNILYLDVRDKNELKISKMDNDVKWINIELNQLRKNYTELDKYKDKIIVPVCAVGKRGYLATRFLKQKGYNVQLGSGGIMTYFMLKSDFRYRN